MHEPSRLGVVCWVLCCAGFWLAGCRGVTQVTPPCAPSGESGGTCNASSPCARGAAAEGVSCDTPPHLPACEVGRVWVAPKTCGPDRVRIPASGATTRFTMGRPASDAWGHFSEQPAHQVTLSAFAIDRYPVTAAAYQACVEAGGCTAPDRGDPCTYGALEKSTHPINCVDWDQASAYCAWAGGRLPTSAEWERAAKGESPLRFPWGQDCPASWDASCSGAEWTPATAKANCAEDHCNDGYDHTSPVDAFPAGLSPDGLYDMVGNVWEWTRDGWLRTYTTESVTNPTGPKNDAYRVIRGSSWHYGSFRLRAALRFAAPPGKGQASIGFRCAASPSAQEL